MPEMQRRNPRGWHRKHGEDCEISTQGATDVLGIDVLYDGGTHMASTPVSRREVFDFEGVSDNVFNIEGMTFRPEVEDR